MDEPLRERLRPVWPAIIERIGERWPAFESAVRAKAVQHGLAGEAAIARYAGLCLSFGPGFEDKPEHEWALALLADERLAEWVKLHQVVQRAADTLRRRGTPAQAQALLDADAGLLDALDAQQQADDPDQAPLPRRACDIDAADLRVLDADWRQEYRLVEGAWQRVPVPSPASLRIDATRPAPPHASVLSHASGQGPAALLQLRQIPHGGCGERHPATQWIDAVGLKRWQGHEARAVSWPVHAMVQPPAPPGLGSALVEETSPAVHLLAAQNCGVRDMGVPVGSVQLQVWAYPAHQWLFALQHKPAFERHWPSPSAPQPAEPTRVRLDRDGQPVAAPAWADAFDRGLQQALSQAMERLWASWSGASQEPAMSCRARLLEGRAALAWGWREGPGGIADTALLRLQGELDLACAIELSLSGEVEVGASRTRLRLQAEGGGPLRLSAARERADTPLLETLLPATVQWRCPFTIDFDPVANDEAVVAQAVGPCSGALVGEAGLRPRQAGSGWQWFVRLGLEPVLAPVTLHDPVLGQVQRRLALLEAAPVLLEWSVG